MVGDNRRIELPDFKRVRVAVGSISWFTLCPHASARRTTHPGRLNRPCAAATRSNGRDRRRCGRWLAGSRERRASVAAGLRRSDIATIISTLRLSAEPKVASQLDLDFLALIDSLEEEMARNRRAARQDSLKDRTILVGVATGSIADAEESMAELAELALAAGIVVQDKIIQRRQAIDPRTVLGRGKLDELIIRALQLGADMLVFDRELSSGTSQIVVGSDRFERSSIARS